MYRTCPLHVEINVSGPCQRLQNDYRCISSLLLILIMLTVNVGTNNNLSLITDSFIDIFYDLHVCIL
jgi:hypothetical protein